MSGPERDYKGELEHLETIIKASFPTYSGRSPEDTLERVAKDMISSNEMLSEKREAISRLEEQVRVHKEYMQIIKSLAKK